ncbi:hypothetical protein JK361_22530 [Streptomyces sp. 5-8]|uniref:Uncharacterized protein n=1 Tax=Streptomyces musisoli TaxID=2802280 RepID=A0ABS1P4Q2_9ACTN|nr:hypothetical protein [Streptomyces musisoli]MBL1107346.1 hypothetical protein [Streptomyces musisoli]
MDEAFPVRIRQGVKPSYQNQQLKVRPAATPNMTVIVSGGICYIDQHDTGGQGAYVCANDADVTLTVQPAGGAGQYRKDTVVASVYDAEYAGSANEWRLEVIQGPYAASAGATVRGTLPPNAQILADIALGPSQTSVSAANITDVRQFTVGSGGIVPVSSSADLARPHPGQLRYRMDTDTWVYGKTDGTTATLLDASLRARKTGDTPRANTTSVASDPHLVLPVAAGAIYELVGVFYITSASTVPDFQCGLNGPASSDGFWSLIGNPNTATSDSDVARLTATTINGGNRSYGIPTTSTVYGLQLAGMLEVGGTAGNLTVDWAQATTSGSSTVLKKYSWIRAVRVA